MLEIKNVTKVYRTKGGAETRALDNVSIRFDKTGLVFLLGKSGSGKSTLLNIAGGLDEPTSGEVVVMGKSSKDFSGSDFDSYRNTFIGFVFQEYNVLNEFNVEDNIALALELQGKKKDREKIVHLLQEVELGAFAKRKPNTLSGGQKQRIAIARALIKDPQIIMADEPTGALDSATGKQVFDTLKQLSKTRLVIVVSHDREFAEIYGDRIVELKDGKIISDVTKSHEPPTVVNENVTRIGEDTLTVKAGTPDKETLAAIQAFLAAGEGDLLISRSGKDIASFKRANRIDDDNKREHFVDTPEDAVKPYEGEKAKFIRSRLPASKAIKIGASGLKLKPFRLILTIFLSFVAFVMFGLFSTMMFYDGDSVMMESFTKSSYDYLAIGKYYETRTTTTYSDGDTYSYTSQYSTRFTPEELASFRELDAGAFGAYELGSYRPSNWEKTKGDYYSPRFDKVAVLGSEHPLVSSEYTYPQAANEIWVSSYFLDCAINNTFKTVDDDGKIGAEKNINTAADLVGENLLVSGAVFKITGVFASGSLDAKFDGMKNEGANVNWLLTYEFESALSEGLHSLILASDAFLTEYADLLRGSNTYKEYFRYGNQITFVFPVADYSYTSSFSSYAVYDPNATDLAGELVFIGEKPAVLGDKQIVVPSNYLMDLLNYRLYEVSEELGEEEQYEKYNALEEVRQAIWLLQNPVVWDDQAESERPATEAEIQEAREKIVNYLKAEPFTREAYLGGYYDGYSMVNATRYGNVEIVGFYIPDFNKYYSYGVYCSQKMYDDTSYGNTSVTETNYVEEADATYSSVLIPFDRSEQAFSAIYERIGEKHKNAETDVMFLLENSLYNTVLTANSLVDTLSTIFLWVGVGIAVFAALLLFNFISMSISNKRKEIGILRAVGARGTDVFKIFFAESGIIVGICTVLALIGTVALTIVLNIILRAQVGLAVSLFVFGPLSALVMIGVALFVAFISTFLPVFLAARKKPVDSIRAL